MTNQISTAFERSFLRDALDVKVRHCDNYELAPLLRSVLADHAPVFEAGCGSGRWVIWLTRHGIPTIGMDWSQTLCERARFHAPECEFLWGDVSDTSFADGSFGSVLALGTIEHDVRGPLAALREFHRVLRPGGVAVLSVPYESRIWRFSYAARWPMRRLRASRTLRRATGRIGAEGASLAEARRATTRAWSSEFLCGPNGWAFYEYRFTPKQMRRFLSAAGFETRHEFVAFASEGILHSFGRLAGRWDAEEGCVIYTSVGRVLAALLPTKWTGHMLCYVVSRG